MQAQHEPRRKARKKKKKVAEGEKGPTRPAGKKKLKK